MPKLEEVGGKWGSRGRLVCHPRQEGERGNAATVAFSRMHDMEKKKKGKHLAGGKKRKGVSFLSPQSCLFYWPYGDNTAVYGVLHVTKIGNVSTSLFPSNPSRTFSS